ncbi:hypothetical protein K438DRAFT_2017560 [Mycena galopus ATCC 62051]|nr:hypothetical protein K438DRAFT_2017560 [Mycena galopus ATCC 62051]
MANASPRPRVQTTRSGFGVHWETFSSAREMAAVLTSLPSLSTIDLPASTISQPPSTHFFLGIRPCAVWPCLATPPTIPTSSPKFEHLVHLIAWVLAAPQPFPHLHIAIIELHGGIPGAGPLHNSYRAAPRGLAWRPTADFTLALQLNGCLWAPWNAPDSLAPSAAGRLLSRVAHLQPTIHPRSRVPRCTLLVAWLRLFGGMRQVALFAPVPPEDLWVFLRREFSGIALTAWTSKKYCLDLR